MVRLLELGFDLWIFGLPVVMIGGALLLLLAKAPGRVPYLIAVAAFLASIALPVAGFLRGANPIAPAAASVVATGVSDTPAIHATVPAYPLAVVWPLLAIVLLVREVAGHLRLRRLRTSSRRADDELRQRLDWPRRLSLDVAEIDSPITIGLLCPRVIVPESLADVRPREVRRRIALHELSHRSWRDPLVHALLRLLAVLFWPAPAWICLAWVRREREVAADEAGRGASDDAAYAEALLRLARRQNSGPRLAITIAGGDLEFRVRRILAVPPKRLSTALAIAILVPGAIFVVRATPLVLASPAARIIRSVTPVPVIATNVAPVALPSIPAPAPARVRKTRVKRSPPPQKAHQPVAPTATETTAPSPPEPTPPDDRHVDIDRHIDIDQHIDVDRHVASDGRAEVAAPLNTIRIPDKRKIRLVLKIPHST
jgi:beta-lactamase regulating signal transducer with metallopeptidase domain